jgi:hypothetical protein
LFGQRLPDDGDDDVAVFWFVLLVELLMAEYGMVGTNPPTVSG